MKVNKLNKMEEKMYKAYCVKCKEKVEVKDPRVEEMKNSKGVRNAVKGTCPVCGTKLNAFIKKDGA